MYSYILGLILNIVMCKYTHLDWNNKSWLYNLMVDPEILLLFFLFFFLKNKLKFYWTNFNGHTRLQCESWIPFPFWSLVVTGTLCSVHADHVAPSLLIHTLKQVNVEIIASLCFKALTSIHNSGFNIFSYLQMQKSVFFPAFFINKNTYAVWKCCCQVSELRNTFQWIFLMKLNMFTAMLYHSL